MANGKKGDAQRIGAAERRIQALAYRKAGASFRQIADTLAVSLATGHDDVQSALAELAAEQQAEAKELRALEAARLDSLQAAVWSQALHGNLKAVQTVLRIMERRARLLGLDMQPGTDLPTDLAIILRWADGRNIIDVTPDNGSMASPTPLQSEPNSAAPGALPMHLRWETMGRVEVSCDAESEERA